MRIQWTSKSAHGQISPQKVPYPCSDEIINQIHDNDSSSLDPKYIKDILTKCDACAAVANLRTRMQFSPKKILTSLPHFFAIYFFTHPPRDL